MRPRNRASFEKDSAPDMPFPVTPRVLYAKNPLDEVVCQLRFPPILRIDSEVPAAFQEQIRAFFPLFKEKTQPEIELELPKDQASLLGSKLASGKRQVAYEFTSEDGKWLVALNRDFLALKCHSYSRWEEFKERFELPVQTFVKEYRPAYYSRVGLRYVDGIRCKSLGLDNVPWAELLKPHITGELCMPEVAAAVDNTSRDISIRLNGNEGVVRIRHGLGTSKSTGEICYVIDADFYTDQKTEIADATGILNHFNRKAGQLFRWCIADKLHDAMEPRDA